jgi:predicted 3-demethylubiquinone-9 3-methyltransferase (glyoxalase superfamily)
MQKIALCLWFDTQAEQAATLYTSLFKNSRILDVSRYGEGGRRADGSVMTVSFELDGQRFVALNGGPDYTFGGALSLQVACESQDEVDQLWNGLTDGGEEGSCGWCRDRFGLAWQIVPAVLGELLTNSESGDSAQAMQAMLGMRKLDIAALESAYRQ